MVQVDIDGAKQLIGFTLGIYSVWVQKSRKGGSEREVGFYNKRLATLPPQDAECGMAMRARAAQGHEVGSYESISGTTFPWRIEVIRPHPCITGFFLCAINDEKHY